MQQLVVLVAGFILTGLIGNRLLQHWQYRGWLRQQQFLGHEKEYLSLKALAEEMSSAMGIRLYHMKRLIAAARSQSLDKVEERLMRYDEALVSWNEALNSYNAKLTFYASYARVDQLEYSVQSRFVKAGAKIESAVRMRRGDKFLDQAEYSHIDAELNSIQGSIYSFSRDLMRDVHEKRALTYFGSKIRYDEDGINKFSNFQLIKALFIRSVDGHSVFSPALNFGIPV